MIYILFDLESTCWRGKPPGFEEEMDRNILKSQSDTIEIGAVAYEPKNKIIVGEFQTFIKPLTHPWIHRFCTELTGIGQAHVDNGTTFKQALNNFYNWSLMFLQNNNKTIIKFMSWGDYDIQQLGRDTKKFFGKENSFPFNNIKQQHINIKTIITNIVYPGHKGLGISSCLNKLNLKFEGNAHRAIDDAKNIARILEKTNYKGNYNEKET